MVRKGATPAFPGQKGFVGGSMGGTAGPFGACIPVRWFHVKGEASMTAKISGTYDSCAGGSWTPDADATFEVTSGWGGCE